MSVVLRTAADALFNVMKIPFKPLVDGEQGAQGGILIWGGGSAVGPAAIQLAKSAGLSPIITTASSRNHGALKSMGATHCFDYSDDDVVAKIQAVLDAQSQPLVYVFDTVGSTGESASWKHCEALHCSPEMICVATVPIVGSKYKWQWCVAARGWDLPMPPPIGFTPASAEYESRLVNIVDWAAVNYGSGFRVPNITVINDARKAIEAIRLSGEGQVKFQKFVIQHPLKDQDGSA